MSDKVMAMGGRRDGRDKSRPYAAGRQILVGARFIAPGNQYREGIDR
jgi:hypothetical protein